MVFLYMGQNSHRTRRLMCLRLSLPEFGSDAPQCHMPQHVAAFVCWSVMLDTSYSREKRKD